MKRSQTLKSLEQIRYDLTRMSAIVTEQLKMALDAFTRFDSGLAAAVIEKDDLVDNLNLRVESASYEVLQSPAISDAERRAARSALKVAVNIERVGDSATHIAKRISLMRLDGVEPRQFDFEDSVRLALQSVHDGVWAYLHEDLALARRACETEPELDRLYVNSLRQIASSVEKDPPSVRYFLHLLPVLKYLEKIGDYVLNIGEQAIYAITGKRLKFTQFQQLDALLQAGGDESEFSSYLDGISGARVARIGVAAPVVFKEGSQRKIDEEINGSAAWSAIDEGLTPKVLSTSSYEDRRAFLREYVDGFLLSHLYFEGAEPELQLEATRKLCDTLRRVWVTTMKPEPPPVDYVSQIEDRLDEVYSFHPHIKHLVASQFTHRSRIVPPLSHQLKQARGLEAELAPPFSVWLHGDFNPNNIVYNPDDESIKFIDIHRSRYGDYLQDITVFLVGLKRDPDLSPSVRKQLVGIERAVLDCVKAFAAEFGDASWQKRLLLGMGRSYLTSARVTLHPAHAERLFRQGRIALHQLTANA